MTRGAAPRNHSFPDPPATPTVYASVIVPGKGKAKTEPGRGVKVHLTEDIRWSRCDIKSYLCFQTPSASRRRTKRYERVHICQGRIITEGLTSNIFFVIDGTLFTHPESNYILSGVTRKNIIRIARIRDKNQGRNTSGKRI